MTSSRTPSLPLATLLLLLVATLFSSIAMAQEISYCPPAADIVYSPFQRVSAADYQRRTSNTDNGCWWWAGCVLTAADEARKQQFASVALVMGLIPLTLKDIAWPERRIVMVSRELNLVADVLVRALGLIAVVVSEPGSTTTTYDASSFFALRFVRSRAPSHAAYWKVALLAASLLGLLLSYASLAVVEIYSKRSALGCPYPVFILTWHLVALVPAAITSLLASSQPKDRDFFAETRLTVIEPPEEEEEIGGPSSEASVSTPMVAGHDQHAYDAARSTSYDRSRSQSQDGHEMRSINLAAHKQDARTGQSQVKEKAATKELAEASAVPGRGMSWPIQLSWAIYYIAGTLLYSAIMAVTVVELVVWVFASMFAAAMSKALAMSICTFF
ncbi:hypothetical protein PVAG01_01939 [Phlyctema vagabunda]|uniref:Uncharacterized protein n=1 Tax=Phlyctema vagabunda TaxID=108571 RepID=A0ABR4PYJ2_9HELO